MKRRKMVLFLLWLLSLLAISFYGGAVSYGFFFGISLIPVVSLVYLLMVHERFRIYQEIGCREVLCGQEMPYFFVLQNGDHCAFASVSVRLFPELSYVEQIPDDMEFELLPGERYTFETNLVCRYRGEYEVGVKEVTITDFFRIFRLKYKLPSTIKAIVLPRVRPIGNVNSIPEVVSLVQRDAWFSESQPDVTVRDYIPGDAIKQIHWKATAREQKLKTRNRIGEEKRGITIFLDTRRESEEPYKYLPLENQMLEVVLALGMFFAEHQMPYSMYWQQNDIRESHVQGIEHFETLYQQMAKVLFDKDNNSLELMETLAAQGIIADTKIVIGVVHEIDDKMLEQTEALAAQGVMVVLYFVTEKDAESLLRQSSERRRIVVVPIEAELEGLI